MRMRMHHKSENHIVDASEQLILWLLPSSTSVLSLKRSFGLVGMSVLAVDVPGWEAAAGSLGPEEPAEGRDLAMARKSSTSL